METLKLILAFVGLLIAGIVAFMRVKARTDRANDLIEKIEQKVDRQDKDIIDLTRKIDLVLEKLKPLEKLDKIIHDKVNSEIDSRELHDLKK